MPKHQITIWLMLTFSTAIFASSQSDADKGYVYLVRIPATAHHKAVIQTGFRMRGTPGIITTLHGVSDGTTFSAENESGDILTDLSVSMVDFSHDLALLSSPKLNGRQKDGITARTANVLPAEALHVWGHPLAINLYSKPVNASNPPTRALIQLIPPAIVGEFAARKCPSTKITILSLDGNLVPGDSGAPVLDSNGYVVGIEDGGLLGGAAGISWAIPCGSITWMQANRASSDLQGLAAQNSTNLFSFSDLADEAKQRQIVDGAAFQLGIAVAFKSYFDTALSKIPNHDPKTEPDDFKKSMSQNRAKIAALLKQLDVSVDSGSLDYTASVVEDYQSTPAADLIAGLISAKQDERTVHAFRLGLRLEGCHWIAHKKRFAFSFLDNSGFPGDLELKIANRSAAEFGVKPEEPTGGYLNREPFDVDAYNRELEVIFTVLEQNVSIELNHKP